MGIVQTSANRASAIKRHHGPESIAYVEARRQYAASAIEQAVDRYLAASPPLSDDQVERIAARLRGVDPTGGDE